MHLLGWVFAVSCLAKLIWPEVTLRVLAEVWGFGRPVSIGLFAALVALEAALALLLITGWRPRWSLAAAGIFLVGVTASPVLQAMTGSELSCGCGLSAEAATTPLAHWFVVGRNAFLVALGGLCVMFIPPLSE